MSNVLKNIPNILTISRIVLAPIFFILFIYGYSRSAFICFFVASMTDILDGFLARRFNIVSKFGKLYDPLADKVFIFLGFASIWIELGNLYSSHLDISKCKFFTSDILGGILNLSHSNIIVLFLIILILRDLVVTALREEKFRKDKIILKTTFIAKLKTVMLFITIHLFLLLNIINLSLPSVASSFQMMALFFECCLCTTLTISLWSLASYINQYRKKNI